MIEHPSGETTIYAHMNAVTVAVGQTVDQGTQVGTVGNTGNSFGAHLHFEERTSSGSVRWPWFDGSAFTFGTTPASRNCVDVPLAGNFLRDGKAEVAVFRRGAPSQFRIQRPDRGPKVVSFGSSTDQPVVGDWDGDGYSDVGVRTPGTRTFSLRTAAGVTSVVLGKPRDLPLAGDWDGDGSWEVGRTPCQVRPVRPPGRRRDHEPGRPRRRHRRAGHRGLGRRRRHRPGRLRPGGGGVHAPAGGPGRTDLDR